jgi:cytoskeletal protein CcmA (bactofilin family)
MSLFRRKSPEDAEPKLGKPLANVADAAPDKTSTPPNPAAAPAVEIARKSPETSLSPEARPLQGAPMASSRTPSAGFVPEIPRRTIDLPGAPTRKPVPGQRGGPEGKRLTVGREISLSGEITACETLIVEGSVEATLENSQFLVIDEAVIAGNFDGTLTARERLTVKSTGRITGHVKFTRIEIELGGEIDGEIHVLQETAASEAPAAS